jgi:glycosyltransferase involved in cell wall biosynthesis
MQDWVDEGVVEYLGATEDVKPYLAASDVIVLPSYREGVPRSLLEAAAIGRPIVTTDAVGCRDAVDDGVNGFLCNICDADDLVEKMIRMMVLSPSDRIAMGAAGRAKMEQEFDEQIVINRYLEVVNTIPRNECD